MGYLDQLDSLAHSPQATKATMPAESPVTAPVDLSGAFAGFVATGDSENHQNASNDSVAFVAAGQGENATNAAPVWIVRFADGKRYVVHFDPPITEQELLTRWAQGHPDQSITVSRPASATPPTATINPQQVLSDMGIDSYIPRQPLPVSPAKQPAPEFTLTAEAMPTAPTPAGVVLERFGYTVRYLREPEPARQALAAMLDKNPALLGIDIETMALPEWRLDAKSGLDPYKAAIRLVQVADADTVLIFDHLHLPAELLAPVMERTLIAHNAGFEYRFLVRAGLMPRQLHDSMLLCRIATGRSHSSLADCAQAQLGIAIDKSLQVSSWHHPELTPAQLDYAGLDAALALKLWPAYSPLIKATGQLDAYKRLVRALPVVARQMLAGVPFNARRHREMIAAWQAELEPLREQLTGELGINPDSPAQLATWLAKTLDAKTLATWPKTKSGQLVTDADTLAQAEHPALATLRRYKVLSKQLGTYGNGYADHIHPVTGRLHADFGIAGTKGGRFSCRNPNIQNPPRDADFRRLFAAPEGRLLVVADYSQVELRIAARLAPDSAMLDAYRQGADLHVRTAAAIAGVPESQVSKAQRQLAKACNFGLIYGMGARGLAAYAASSYGVEMPFKEAEKARNAFFAAYPGIAAWHSRTQANRFKDRTVRTRGGLLRDLAKEPYGWKLTEALNTPVQGSGADCLLESIIALPQALAGLDAFLIHHVHDEVVLECSERDADAAKHALTEAMIQGFMTLFPEADMPGLVEAHSGPNWHDAKG